jgi:thiosulfate dehydrogenase [quinone] large subunit
VTTAHGRLSFTRHAGGTAAAGPHVRITRGAVAYVWAAARLALGWVFLWAFLDKLFGLGHDTPAAQAWINGGSPTKGFLGHGAVGPMAGFYHSIAGAGWADWLFMVGLLGIGAALMLGIGMRIASAAGVLLLVMMYAVVLPPDSNVFMDDHLIYAVVLIGLAIAGAGDTVGLGAWWKNTALVKRL